MSYPQVGYPQIYTTEQLNTLAFYLVNTGNGKFVTTFGSNASALHALGDHANKESLFQFVPAGNGEVKIFSLFHRGFVSAIGAGWPLFPRVEDESWSRFKLEINKDGTICFASVQPIAKDGAYVSVIGESRILRIAEKTPRQPWSYFIPYSADSIIKDITSFVSANKYVASPKAKKKGIK
jgi:hypothetical protein